MFIEANGMEISLFIYFFILSGFKKEEIGNFSLRAIFYGNWDTFCGILNNEKSASDCNLCSFNVKSLFEFAIEVLKVFWLVFNLFCLIKYFIFPKYSPLYLKGKNIWFKII